MRRALPYHMPSKGEPFLCFFLEFFFPLGTLYFEYAPYPKITFPDGRRYPCQKELSQA